MIRDGRLALTVVFYRTTAGREPCRDWLRGLTDDDRRAVGYDIKTAQYGWPLGMHGFTKKSRRIPMTDLKTARVRLASLQEERSR